MDNQYVEAGAVLAVGAAIIQRMPGLPGMMHIGLENSAINTLPMSLADIDGFIGSWPGITAFPAETNYVIHMAMFGTWILLALGVLTIILASRHSAPQEVA